MVVGVGFSGRVSLIMVTFGHGGRWLQLGI